MTSYLTSVIKQFEYYKSLGDKTFEQLTVHELKKQSSDNSNTIATIVKHVSGNMLSRWTNFLNEDGEKPWRQRDSEFIDNLESKEHIIESWNTGWTCLFNAINNLQEGDLNTIVYIRNQGHTVVEAINRQMMHYAYHIGQIVFMAKTIKGTEWQSLSIAKGQSDKYNSEKFSKEKGNRH